MHDPRFFTTNFSLLLKMLLWVDLLCRVYFLSLCYYFISSFRLFKKHEKCFFTFSLFVYNTTSWMLTLFFVCKLSFIFATLNLSIFKFNSIIYINITIEINSIKFQNPTTTTETTCKWNQIWNVFLSRLFNYKFVKLLKSFQFVFKIWLKWKLFWIFL